MSKLDKIIRENVKRVINENGSYEKVINDVYKIPHVIRMALKDENISVGMQMKDLNTIEMFTMFGSEPICTITIHCPYLPKRPPKGGIYGPNYTPKGEL